ncbi:hypothetical protein [Methylobacterium sp. UNC378MF]|uniref:hypothetical protein n=1 Tax=Methylobacterium sp. UNC378MF TaxID=1502748 RepID=UPI000B8934D7|nr:hypothetical protein [Methylobacterium sp. UNC378MF]
MEADCGRDPVQLNKVEDQLDHFRVEEFLDRAMREISEIVPELRPWTIRGAELRTEPLTRATPK